MKNLAIIIGRAPPKNKDDKNEQDWITWHVDLEINSAVKISRQQAFIAYNFYNEEFEIKNLSRENEIYVNCTPYTYKNDPVPLKSSDVIQIGTEDFVFLLPVESKSFREESDSQDMEEIKMQDFVQLDGLIVDEKQKEVII